jgi:hypothetical protein
MQDDREVLKSLSKPELWAIVEHHAHNLGIGFEVAKNPSQVAANPVDRMVRGCPVRGKATLAAMLHEIGHIASMSEEKRENFFLFANSYGAKDFLLGEERRAWTWAKHNCPIWDGEMLAHAKIALGSHERRDGNLGRQCAENMVRELGDDVCQKLTNYVTRGTM